MVAWLKENWPVLVVAGGLGAGGSTGLDIFTPEPGLTDDITALEAQVPDDLADQLARMQAQIDLFRTIQTAERLARIEALMGVPPPDR